MKNLLILIAFLAISNITIGQGIELTATGNWAKTFSASDISNAGNDYPGSFTSNNNQTLLTINPSNKIKEINVTVKKNDIAWHPTLNLKVKRFSNGANGNVNISGGTDYQLITNFDTNFFICKDYHTFIPLQYEITGISVLLPVQSFSTEIVYTVMHL